MRHADAYGFDAIQDLPFMIRADEKLCVTQVVSVNSALAAAPPTTTVNLRGFRPTNDPAVIGSYEHPRAHDIRSGQLLAAMRRKRPAPGRVLPSCPCRGRRPSPLPPAEPTLR